MNLVQQFAEAALPVGVGRKLFKLSPGQRLANQIGADAVDTSCEMLQVKTERSTACPGPDLLIRETLRVLLEILTHLFEAKQHRHNSRMNIGERTSQPWLWRRWIHLCLPHVAGVSQRVSAGLRENTQPMRAISDLDACLYLSGRSVKHVNFTVVTSGQPKLLAVRGHTTHVGASAARDGPTSCNFSCLQINERNGTTRVIRPCSSVRDVHVLRIAAEVEPVSTHAGWNEIDLFELFAVDDVYAI